MRNRAATVLAVVVVLLSGCALHHPSTALSREASSPNTALRDSEEVKRLHDEDQADRASETIDWSVVGPRDSARLSRVKELFAADSLHRRMTTTALL